MITPSILDVKSLWVVSLCMDDTLVAVVLSRHIADDYAKIRGAELKLALRVETLTAYVERIRRESLQAGVSWANGADLDD